MELFSVVFELVFAAMSAICLTVLPTIFIYKKITK